MVKLGSTLWLQRGALWLQMCLFLSVQPLREGSSPQPQVPYDSRLFLSLSYITVSGKDTEVSGQLPVDATMSW